MKAIGKICSRARAYLKNADLVHDILDKLPSALSYNFDSYVHRRRGSVSGLEALAKFLARRADMSRSLGSRASRETRDAPRGGREARAVYTTTEQAGARPVDVRGEMPTRRGEMSPLREAVTSGVRAGLGRRAKAGFGGIDGNADGCRYCGRVGHGASRCFAFEKLAIDERWRWVREENRCFSCLDRSHHQADCREKRPCSKSGCRAFHHPTLHYQSGAGGSGQPRTRVVERGRGKRRQTDGEQRSDVPPNATRRDRENAPTRNETVATA